jgi:transposase
MHATIFDKKRVTPHKKVVIETAWNSVFGCDVDSINVHISCLKRGDKYQDSFVFPQTRQGVLDAITLLKANNVEFGILESTGTYSSYFYDEFRKVGINAHIINPVLVSALLKTLGKNDAKDAMNLARLALNFELKTSNMPDDRMKEVRFHFRGLDKVKVYRIALTNNAHAILRQNSIGIFQKKSVQLNSPSGIGILNGIASGMRPFENLAANWLGRREKLPELLEKFPSDEPCEKYVQEFLTERIAEIVELNDRVERLNEKTFELIDKLGLRSLTDLMVTVPGFNYHLALRLLGEMGIDFPLRYSNAEKFVRAMGLCSNNKVSGGKLLKQEASFGNMFIKIAVLNHTKSMCINKALPTHLKIFYNKYFAKKKVFQKAVSATARKACEALYYVVKHGVPFKNFAEVTPMIEAEETKAFDELMDNLDLQDGADS